MMSPLLSVDATTPLVPVVTVVVDAVTPGVTMMPGSLACWALSWSVWARSHGSEKSGYCGGDCANAGEAAMAKAMLATLPRTRFFFSIFVSFGLGSRRGTNVVAGTPI